MTDAAAQLQEQATYCKPNDPKRPSQVGLPDATVQQICPADGSAVQPVTSAYPDGWYVRIMFDELLDPSIEELTELPDEDGNPSGTFSGSIAASHPVNLQCQNVAGAFVDVDYDGYYQPAGNNITWPLGPSLVIKPNLPTTIATGAECRVTINDNVTDKDGNQVPTDQRTTPFTFKIAEITPIATDPTDSGDTAEPVAVDALGPYYDNFYFQFNTEVQLSSICKLDTTLGLFCQGGTETFSLTPAPSSADAGGGWNLCSDTLDPCDVDADCGAGATCMVAYAYTYSGLPTGTEVGIGYATPLKTDTTYTFAFKAGAKLKDRCGAETTIPAPTASNLYSITFHTNKFDFKKITIATGETAGPVKKPNIQFNNVVDPTSLSATEYTLTPAPANAATGQFTGGDIILGGNYALDTQYTLTIKAGATVTDPYGATFTNAADKVITWKTAASIVMSSATADNTVFQKIVTVQPVGPSMNFNANMDLTTLDASEWSIVNAATMAPVAGVASAYGSSAASANCTPTSQSCQFRWRLDYPPGDYIFTLKKGATINDKLGNVYTQAADKVIHFTVKAAVPADACL